MTDIARARDALHALLKLKTINKDARYFAETALSHLQGDVIFTIDVDGVDFKVTIEGLTSIVVERQPKTVTLDRRTPDSPYELPPGRDPPSITCPRCGRTSYHPVDIEKKYCGACHEFHEDIDTFKREGW